MKNFLLSLLLIALSARAEIISGSGVGVTVIGGTLIPVNSTPETWRSAILVPDLVGTNGILLSSSNLVSLDTTVNVQPAPSSATNQVLDVSKLVTLIELTNDCNFVHATNMMAGLQGQLVFRSGSTNRQLWWNSSWKFLGAAAPTTIASNKVANLAWIVLGTDQTNVICGYAVQP